MRRKHTATAEFLLEKEIMSHEVEGKKRHFHNWYVQHNSKNTCFLVLFFFPLGLLNWAHPQFTLKSWLKKFWDIPSLFCTVKNKIQLLGEICERIQEIKMQFSHHKRQKCIPLQNGKVTETRWHWFLRTKLEQETQSILLNGWHYPSSQCFPNREEFKTSPFYVFHFPSVPDYLPIRKALLHRHHR